MRKLLISSALTLCIALPALPALAAEPSAASLERLLNITEAQKLSESTLKQVDGMLRPAMEQAIARGQMTPEQRQQAQAAIAEFTQKMQPILSEELGWERMKPIQLELYRSTFTQEEIDGLISFYESPAGRAMVEKMPLLMQKLMGVMQQRMGPLSQRIGAAAQEAIDAIKSRKAADKKAS